MIPVPVFLAITEEEKLLFNNFKENAFPSIDELYNFALRMTGSDKLAYKLLRETFVKAYEFYDMLDESIVVKDWLLRVMRNIFFDPSKKNKKQAEKDDYGKVEKFFENADLLAEKLNGLKDEVLKLDSKTVSDELASLHEDFRTVIVLVDIKGFSYEETADFIDLPVGIVRARIHKGRKALFKNLYTYTNKK
jgi:RNA polymerase sigma-70 factor, ECF subfamily